MLGVQDKDTYLPFTEKPTGSTTAYETHSLEEQYAVKTPFTFYGSAYCISDLLPKLSVLHKQHWCEPTEHLQIQHEDL